MRPSRGQKADGHAGIGHEAGAAPGRFCGKGSWGPLAESPQKASSPGWRCPEASPSPRGLVLWGQRPPVCVIQAVPVCDWVTTGPSAGRLGK